MKIEPHRGTDTLRFGSTQDEVRAALGEPEETETAVLDGDTETTAWHYWESGLSLFFDSDTDNRLCTIEVDGPEATLQDRKMVGLAVVEAMAALEQASAPSPVFHEEEGFVEIPDWDLNLWLENGVVESVQWEVKRNALDEPEWPGAGS